MKKYRIVSRFIISNDKWNPFFFGKQIFPDYLWSESDRNQTFPLNSLSLKLSMIYYVDFSLFSFFILFSKQNKTTKKENMLKIRIKIIHSTPSWLEHKFRLWIMIDLFVRIGFIIIVWTNIYWLAEKRNQTPLP